jgi:hypothetical protein
VRQIAAPALALGVFGYAIDLRLRRSRPDATPQLLWVVLLLGAAVLGLALEDAALVRPALTAALPGVVIYFLLGHGIQSFRALENVTALILCSTLILSVVAVEQGTAPLGCFRAEAGKLTWDGRSCAGQLDCERGADADYSCEHVGLFGTQSLEGRARYLGWLGDPDQLALLVAVALPFALAFYDRKRSPARAFLALASLGLAVGCSTYTRSRGGQLALLVGISVYGVRRIGARALIGSAALMVFLWFKAGGDAMLSSADRGWYEGMQMFRQAPFLGVGLGQFTEHHVTLAQNSFVVAAAELGLFGFLPLSVVLYLSAKIPLAGLRRLEDPAARSWALALFASWLGLLAGLFFRAQAGALVWIFAGLSGAFYSATRSHDPDFQVRLGWGELLALLAADGVLLGALAVVSALGQ